MNKIALLGATGSIGTSALEVIEANKDKFSISLLVADSNSKKILQQCLKFNPEYVYLRNNSAAKELKKTLQTTFARINSFNLQTALQQWRVFYNTTLINKALANMEKATALLQEEAELEDTAPLTGDQE